jgi:hypothetical protein
VNDGDQQNEEYGEGIPMSSGTRPHPGDMIMSPWAKEAQEGGRTAWLPEPIVGPDDSTPLDEDEPEHTIPPCPLWAMKLHRHVQWHFLAGPDRHERVRATVGSGDDTIYAIDDGNKHVTIGHNFGVSPDGCTYCIIGRLPLRRFEALVDHELAPAHAFDEATDLACYGVISEDQIVSSNVIGLDRYDAIAEIPPDFLPGRPFIEFDQDLESNLD